jgi:hypothetical protein
MNTPAMYQFDMFLQKHVGTTLANCANLEELLSEDLFRRFAMFMCDHAKQQHSTKDFAPGSVVDYYCDVKEALKKKFEKSPLWKDMEWFSKTRTLLEGRAGHQAIEVGIAIQQKSSAIGRDSASWDAATGSI